MYLLRWHYHVKDIAGAPYKIKQNKCISKTDTNPPFAFQIAFPRGIDFTGFLQEGQQEVKVIWQKAPHAGPIPRLGVTPGGRKLYHWIPGVGFPISVP